MCVTNTAMGYLLQMNETTENFFKAWAEWDRRAPDPVFFRLYYNDQGFPVAYSMEDIPGNFIEIDQATYARSSYHVRVVDGKLVNIEYKQVYGKLQPSNTGTSCHPQDVSVVVNTPNTIKWTKVIYEN